jgi:hypothetical protein
MYENLSYLQKKMLSNKKSRTKDQIKTKTVWARRRFSQKTSEQICFSKKANKTNLFLRFLG